jgi:hypothetical protein
MIDTLETAHACGMSLNPVKPNEPSLDITAAPMKSDSFDETAQEWFALTYVLNSLNRSIGMPDSYPFKLSTPVLEKLTFVHKVVASYKKTGIRNPVKPAAPAASVSKFSPKIEARYRERKAETLAKLGTVQTQGGNAAGDYINQVSGYLGQPA